MGIVIEGKSATAIAIVVDPSKKEAEYHAKVEIEQYIPEVSENSIEIKDLGSILFEPYPTTIFLYSKKGGRIK